MASGRIQIPGIQPPVLAPPITQEPQTQLALSSPTGNPPPQSQFFSVSFRFSIIVSLEITSLSAIFYVFL